MITKTWPRALAQRAQSFRRGFALEHKKSRFRPLVEILEDRRLLATITVLTAGDDASASPPTYNPLITSYSVPTLREAILVSNAFGFLGSGANTIDFNITAGSGNRTIQVGTGGGFTGKPLAAITNTVTINGANQAGGNIILDGTKTTSGSGLLLTTGSIISGSPGVPILTTSSGSFISGLIIEHFNHGAGIDVETDSNRIEGNYIGTDSSGSTAAGNVVGVFVGGAHNTIGGSGSGVALGSGFGNLISGNSEDGVKIRGDHNTVWNNRIGTNLGGTAAIANGLGVFILNGNNSVGVGNGKAGIAVGFMPSRGSTVDTSAVGNVFLGNSIFTNGTLGIDLNSDGVPTPTDPNANPSFGSGPNDLLPYPQLDAATNDGTTATVSGHLHSFFNRKFTIEFFASAAPNPSGFGEGAIPLGTIDITTDAAGNASFTFSFAPIAGADFITATATLLKPVVISTGNSVVRPLIVSSVQPLLVPYETSEFSNAILLPMPPPIPPGDTTTVTIITRSFVPPIPPVIPTLPLPQAIVKVILPPPNDPFELVAQFFSRQPLVESPGEIHGRIWEDPNASGKKDGDSLPLEGQIVFIDANNNGVFDEGERFTVTNAKGEYSFTGLPSGTYTVLPLLGRGQDVTFTLARENKVELRSGAMVIDNVDIGIRQRAMRRRRTADAIRYPSMERALAIALFEDGPEEQLNGPEGPLAVPDEVVPVVAPAVIAPAPAEDEPTTLPWHSLVAAAVVGPWYLLNAMQQSTPEREDDSEDAE